MTNHERVLACLNHEQPDVTPYCIGFTDGAYHAMIDYYQDPGFAAKLGNCLTVLDSGGQIAWREVAPNIWVDEFGVQWNREVDKDIGVVCNQVVTRETFDDLALPDPRDPRRYAGYDEVIRNRNGQFVVANLGFSLFERAWTLYGMENLLLDFVADPDFACALLDRILEFNLAVIEQVCSHDVDAMMFGDDWGAQRGVIMGPEMWRAFIKPRVRRMYEAVHDHGKYVFIHSCGKVDALFPDLIECGLNCFNPFQPEVMDVYDMKAQFGDRLSFYGGISTQKTLPYGTQDETRAEVRRLIAEIGRSGGFIASPAHAIPKDAKPENIAAMIEELQNQ